MTGLAPYSRPPALTRLDGRTREARLLHALRAELTAHVGGRPSATQAAIIEQAAQIKLRLAVMDRRFAETGAQTDHDSRTYLAWANSYARLMKQLGLQSPAQKAPRLPDYLAARATQGVAAA